MCVCLWAGGCDRGCVCVCVYLPVNNWTWMVISALLRLAPPPLLAELTAPVTGGYEEMEGLC